jgi:hypothetical protein
MAGTPLDQERFVEKHWHRALRGAGVRPRKFYATRHTFISQAVSTPGISLKWLADYCGTSIEMIERHYGRYMHGDESQLALLAGSRSNPTRAALPAAADSVGCATLGATFRNPRARRREKRVRSGARTSGGGRFEPAQHGTRLTRANAWKLLWRKGFACSRARAAVSRNGPKKPPIAPSNRDRSGPRPVRPPQIGAHARSLCRGKGYGGRALASDRRCGVRQPVPRVADPSQPGAVPRRGSAPESSTQHASNVTETVTVACCGTVGSRASAR